MDGITLLLIGQFDRAVAALHSSALAHSGSRGGGGGGGGEGGGDSSR